jgi:hypothetical protein
MDFAVAPGNPDSRLSGAISHTWMYLSLRSDEEGHLRVPAGAFSMP